MDELNYYNLRMWVIYGLVAICVLWWLVYRQAQGLDQLNAAFFHFVKCPRCRSGQTVKKGAQVKAETEHESEIP